MRTGKTPSSRLASLFRRIAVTSGTVGVVLDDCAVSRLRHCPSRPVPGPDTLIHTGSTCLRAPKRIRSRRLAPRRNSRGYLRTILLMLLCLWHAAVAQSAPAANFVDVTQAAGIDFRHVHGGGGEHPKRYYIETMGSGVAFVDYDGDGYPDIYAVNGQHMDDPAAPRATNELYRNLRDGTFARVTRQAGVGDTGYGMGVTAGDVDNDGDPDLYITNYGPNVLYRNDGDGTFTDATAAAGVGDPGWGVGCAFLDYDNDGDLDLYTANYLVYELADADRQLRPYLARGIQTPILMGYPHPDNFPGQADLLYRNDGDGTFTDVTRPAGVYNPAGKGMGMVCADYDDDGDVDIFVANDQTENFLFQNSGDGTFVEVGLIAGVAYDKDGRTQSGMGADFGDYDNDGDLDLFMTDYQAETSALYENEGDGFFAESAFAVGLAIPSLPYVSWGNIFLDYDNDGDRDLFVANGHVLDNAELFDSSSSYHQPNQLFRNEGPDAAGRWRFRDISDQAGSALRAPRPSRGAAGGDYDNDGDPDLLILNSNLPLTLLRNDSENANHWLAIRPVGRQSNRDGIGARVRVVAGDLAQMAEVRSSSSYLSQNDRRLAFGLGQRTRVDSVIVRWPGGRIDVARDVQVNRFITIEEGAGLVDSRFYEKDK